VAARAVPFVLDAAVRRDDDALVRSWERPRGAVCQPVVGELALLTAMDFLFEDPELVKKAVACPRDADGVADVGARIQEACSEPTEPAIPQRSVGLGGLQLVERRAELDQRGAIRVAEIEVVEVPSERPTDQKLHR
jgi:hypothetical protein